MDRVTRLFSAIAAIACCCAAIAAQSENPKAVLLTITSEQTVAELSAPPVVTITFENSSSISVNIVETNPDRDNELSCVDQNGAPVQLTKYGKGLREAGIWDARTRTVDPGGKVANKISLGKIFNFIAPGQYTVSAKRSFYIEEPRPKSSVVSNGFVFSLRK